MGTRRPRLRWLGSDGPLVVLSEDTAPRWRGFFRDVREGDDPDLIETAPDGTRVSMTGSDEDSDYTRVCAATDESRAKVIAFDGGTALALDTTGHQAAWWPIGGGAIVVKWGAADSELEIIARLGRLPDLEWEHQCEWEPTARVLLGEAGLLAGGEGALAGPIGPGRYTVDHAWVAEPRMFFELFRLRRVPDAPGRDSVDA